MKEQKSSRARISAASGRRTDRMKYLNEKMQPYLEELRAKKAAPGGGAAAALTAAQGAALTMMAAEYTIGNEKYKAFEDKCIGARANSSYIYMNLCMAIDQDAEAYQKVAAAKALPRDTEEEVLFRDTALEKAYEDALLVPFKVMRLCEQGLNAASFMIGACNPNIESDLASAILLLAAGMRMSWMNVLMNLPYYKDEVQKDVIRKECTVLLRYTKKIEEQAEEAGIFPDFAPLTEDDEVQKILEAAGLA